MTTKADIALSDIKEILGREYHPGTRVVNCVAHMNRSIDNRPDDCLLCRSDIRNALSFCMGVNEWLNLWKDDMIEAWKRFATEVVAEVRVLPPGWSELAPND